MSDRKAFADSLRALTRNPNDPPGMSRRQSLSGGTYSARQLIDRYVEENRDEDEEAKGAQLEGDRFDGLS